MKKTRLPFRHQMTGFLHPKSRRFGSALYQNHEVEAVALYVSQMPVDLPERYRRWPLHTAISRLIELFSSLPYFTFRVYSKLSPVVLAACMRSTSAHAENPSVPDVGLNDPHVHIFNDKAYVYSTHDKSIEYAERLRQRACDRSGCTMHGTAMRVSLWPPARASAGSPRNTKRRAVAQNQKPLRVTPRRGFRMLEHETGLEPATPTLARRCWG